MASASLTRQHFTLIAELVATAPVPESVADEVAEHFADKLAVTNPRFNRARFIAACAHGPMYGAGEGS